MVLSTAQEIVDWPYASTLRSVCGDRVAHGNKKARAWRAFLTIGYVRVELADAGGVTVVRAELSAVILVLDE